MEKKVCAVVVTYNRLELLKKCLESLFKQTIRVRHVLVINNKSTDGTEEYLNGLTNKNLIVKNMMRNFGGAKGFSEGVRLAYERTDDDFVWIMDDDTFPNEDCLEELLKGDNKLKNSYGFLCSNARWKDNSSTNIPEVSNNWGEKIDDGLVSVNTATFVSILVPRRIIKELGIPTAELFIWGDDTEYTTRISSKYSSYFVTKSKVLHYTENNLSNMTIVNDSFDRIKRYTFMFRNLIYIDRKYKSKRKAIRRIISEVLMVPSIIRYGKDHRFYRIVAVLKGIFQGMVFNPKVKYVS
ncbi:glycosyltransferase family 2 protein [Companilactobacillus nuruki]|uniref:Glycosyltransferase n=1 Tax=Companilactobacillus nuruki TaxID=1993540 RepID=A0A2N7AT10_9LACO|nr:glycosyltransferase family 2 protein [Companilactobacillus nuruki]PMD68830.1 glycosyltransferase [Companilactobacillus nuruki]